jgi:hypothetical protein
LELNVTPKITPKNLDTQIISKKFLFTEYIEKVPVYRASEKSDDISWDFKNGCDRFKIIPLSPQYHLIISDLRDLHPILHPKM